MTEFFTALEPLISSLGFPVVCVIGLSWFANRTIKDNREDTKAREESYQKQIASFSTSLDRFNDTLNKIDNRLAVVEEAVKR